MSRSHARGHHSAAEETLAALAAGSSTAGTARAVVQAGAAGQPATPLAIGNTPTLVLTKTVTPRVTGKFVVTVSYKVTGDGTGALTVAPTIEAGAIPTPAYAGATVNVSSNVGTFTTDSFECEVDGQTIGVATTFEFLLDGSAAGHITVPTTGASMVVQEQVN